MYGICPDANVIDISHQVPRYSIREGVGHAGLRPAVHADRDPRRGRRSGRRHGASAGGDPEPRAATSSSGRTTGCSPQAADALGGIEEARAISNRVLMLPVISASFHGRDIFSPVAAHLASGVDYATVGPTISIDALARLPVIRPTVGDGDLSSVIVGILIFGNATFAGTPADLEAAIGPLSLGRALILEFPAHGGAPAVEERTVWQRDVRPGAARVLAPVRPTRRATSHSPTTRATPPNGWAWPWIGPCASARPEPVRGPGPWAAERTPT